MEFLVVPIVLVVLGGGICGIVAVIALSQLRARLERLERQIAILSRSQETTVPPSAPAPEPARPPAAEPRILPAPEPVRALIPQTAPPRPTPRREWTSLEVTIGAKWLNWVGVILVVVGVMFFLKYAYDNNWIGPAGRIAIAAMAGTGALILGERLRRAPYPVLFQTLTGGGLAVFYGCIYFSFQVYGLSGQAVSFVLAVAVTVLALALSVVHNAPGICLLGQLGGFLSPVLISTGENRPVELFSFVTILNLATIGCAWFRNWGFVNAAGFIGTWALYAGWAGRYYDESQIGVAVLFSALFYLMFLIAPMLKALSTRQPLLAEDLWLVAAVIFVEFVNNSMLLSGTFRTWHGPAVLLQAVTLSAVYTEWTRRSFEDSRTRTTLLLFALALVTVAIPIQLRFYAIPIAWSVEAVMLGYVGVRYKRWPFQLASLAAAGLATLGLLARLPLHSAVFTPVFNRPFGSWATVIAMMFGLYAVVSRNRERLQHDLKYGVQAVGALAMVLACALAHMEVASFWTVRRDQFAQDVLISHQVTSLSILWAVIPLLILQLGRHGYVPSSVFAAAAGYLAGATVLITSAVDRAWIDPAIPFLNVQWLSRFAIPLSMWIGLKWMNWNELVFLRNMIEAASHVFLAVLLGVEVNSWISSSGVFSPFMRFGFVSALWSLQALILIGLGLKTRSQFRRILGFILFGTTVAKLLLVDMAILQPVYRILSFAATGALLIVAAYLYQRFSRALLDSDEAA